MPIKSENNLPKGAVFLLLTGLVFNSPALASSCPELFAKGLAPHLMAEGIYGGTTLLCNGYYAVLASDYTHGPLWSAEDLTEENLEIADRTQRRGSFFPDNRLPASMQSSPRDYANSHYDRGHMTPSGDEPGFGAQKESFLLSNIVPQTPELNRGVWEGVESAVRGWAREEGEIFVVTGPGYDPDKTQTIGPNHIPVPTVIWKAIYDPAANSTGVYICLNTFHPTCRITSVTTLTRLVNIDPFPGLPDSLKDHVSAMPPIRESPYRLARQNGTRKLLKEWGKKSVQKALRALIRSLVP